MMRKKRRLYSSLSDLDKQKAKSMYLEWRGLLVPRHSCSFTSRINFRTFHIPPAMTCAITGHDRYLIDTPKIMHMHQLHHRQGGSISVHKVHIVWPPRERREPQSHIIALH